MKIWAARTLVNAGSIGKLVCGLIGRALGALLYSVDWKFGTPAKGWPCWSRSSPSAGDENEMTDERVWTHAPSKAGQDTGGDRLSFRSELISKASSTDWRFFFLQLAG
jgi:hypothetical protein